MKITIECNTIDELYALAKKVTFTKIAPELKADEPKEKPEPVKAEPAPEPVKEEPAPAAVEPEGETVSIVDVRKLLSVANKKVGRNIANEWITEEGFKSLTEIKDQAVLKKLVAKAEEVTNAE